MQFQFHIRRLLYAAFVVGFFYIIVQIIRSQRDLWYLGDVDRGARLRDFDNKLRSQPDAQAWRHMSPGKQACVQPRLDINNIDIMRLIKETPPVDCPEHNNWVHIKGSTAYIAERARARHGDIECAFTDIIRDTDHVNHDGITTQTRTEYHLEESDFAKVDCQSSSGARWKNIIAGMRRAPNIHARSSWEKVPVDGLGLNVLIWGFDSLARNMFMRKLPRSYHYLRDTLQAIELQGYNIVGDGTPQALIPILTGKTELELPETRKRMGDRATYVNVYPFVWKEFQDNGYVTAYLEDSPHIGTFTYRLKGFDAAPTDHYMRPFYVSTQANFSSSKKFCQAGVPRHKVMMNYMLDLFRVYSDKPKFGFAFHSELSHNSYNMIGAADGDMLEWLRTLHEEGHLNKTLLVIMSDHGHRFAEIRNTQQGKQEERLPMFSFVFPPWFSQQHPDVMATFRRNSHRLTTPFDINPTLRNILHFEGTGHGDIRNRSISLFKEVPLERTCLDAYIEPHWCACLDWIEVNLADSVVIGGAHAVVDFINKYTSDHRSVCASLRLSRILWAAKLLPNQALLMFRRNADVDGFVADLSARTEVSQEVYQLKLTTTPGDALFEASLRYDVTGGSYTVKVTDISRINRFGPSSRCVEVTAEHLRKYCYCTANAEE